MMLGQLRAAVPFYQRAIDLKRSLENWRGASIGYQNLAELYVSLGDLERRAEADRYSLELARRAEDVEEACHALADQAWAEHLRGNLSQAGSLFQQAEALRQTIPDPGKPYVYCLHRIRYADHLCRVGNVQKAAELLRISQEDCQQAGWQDYAALTQRVWGDLKNALGQPDEAQQHDDEALRIIRSITRRDILIDILAFRGRRLAQHGAIGPAFSDLREALEYAVKSGYRLFEADVRVGLAWAYLAEARNATGHQRMLSLKKAMQESALGEEISREAGYHWGVVDTDEITQRIARQSNS